MADGLRIERRDAATAWPEVRELTEVVYTPEMIAHGTFHDVDWSAAEEWVLGYRHDALVASAGIHRREVTVDGLATPVAGIGGVKTHPDAQRRGYASAILDRTCEIIAKDLAPAFTLIFVEAHNHAFYAKRGWRLFEGAVFVEQHGARRPFPERSVMVRNGTAEAPMTGTIDMNGKPW